MPSAAFGSTQQQTKQYLGTIVVFVFFVTFCLRPLFEDSILRTFGSQLGVQCKETSSNSTIPCTEAKMPTERSTPSPFAFCLYFAFALRFGSHLARAKFE